MKGSSLCWQITLSAEECERSRAGHGRGAADVKGWKRPVWGQRKIRRKKNPETMEITYKEIRENKEINLLIEKGNQVMQALGYTEHSKKHAARVAETAGKF